VSDQIAICHAVKMGAGVSLLSVPPGGDHYEGKEYLMTEL
jgi:hypothetical protein